jgi:hypothetical protein
MKNKIFTTPRFDSRYKRFAKKFRSLEKDVDNLEEKLLATPKLGESLGAGLYKIRLAVESKGGGKSGGFRLITYLLEERPDGIDIFFITIYDKSEDATMQKKTLLELVHDIDL